MIINLLVATIGEGIFKIKDLLLAPRKDLKYIISYQVTADKYRSIPDELHRIDVTLSQIEGRGIARNRNNALSLATGDIALLADDDGRYRNDYFQVIKNVFTARGAPDVACFKIATSEGQPAYKEYPAEAYNLNEESRHYISSLEIAFSLKKIRAKKITFDERFGLGSEPVILGEEAVFIHDCLKAGLHVRYVPQYIVTHSAASLTKSLPEYGRERTIFKGAYDARRYGRRALPAACIDSVRLAPYLKNAGVKSTDYLRHRLQGACYILRTNKLKKVSDTNFNLFEGG